MIGSYEGGALVLDGVPVARIAEEVGTPCYLYSGSEMTRAYRAYEEALNGLGVRVFYAVKANCNLAVIRHFARLGAGMDVVSGGELDRCLAAGLSGGAVVFSGVGKTEAEIEAALGAGVHQINIESAGELALIERVAGRLGKVAPVALRVNPDVDARTHAKITTGKAENKFGIGFDEATDLYAKATASPNLRCVGLAVHIGSQLLALDPYRQAYGKLAELVGALRQAGHTVERLDLGGGIGISYDAQAAPDLAEFAAIVRSTVGGLGCALAIEPGRSLIGQAGWLLTRVLYDKQGETHRFLILDAAMNDLVRPALYGAVHPLVPAEEPPAGAPEVAYDIVGPVCESGDTFARGYALPEQRPGDLLAFTHAGAYCAVMASEYNSRPLCPEVMVREGEFSVIRRRPDLAERLAAEAIPHWLEG